MNTLHITFLSTLIITILPDDDDYFNFPFRRLFLLRTDRMTGEHPVNYPNISAQRRKRSTPSGPNFIRLRSACCNVFSSVSRVLLKNLSA